MQNDLRHHSSLSFEMTNTSEDIGVQPSLSFWIMFVAKSVGAAVSLQLMVAWWRAYGGWVPVGPTNGLYGPSIFPIIIAGIGDLLAVAPSAVCGIVGWLFVIITYRSCKYVHKLWLGTAVIACACLWSFLLVTMLVAGKSLMPQFLRFPL